MCTIIYVDEATSTNSILSAASAKFAHGTAIAARSQTRGRGQRGNSWESEPGKNLTFSILLRPTSIIASRQFELSQTVALSIVKVLRCELDTDEIFIKWPNDIYYRDKKICGILIENSLVGSRIDHSVVGIGVNVNQAEFFSDAPNPVSMVNITGHEFDLGNLLEYFVTQIVNDFDAYEESPNPTFLSAQYRKLLWRGEGFWPYHDNVRGDNINARITAIAPTGHLTLVTDGGEYRTFAFKEVGPVL